MSIRLRDLLGVEYPIIQAPMAGVQGSALAIAVCEGRRAWIAAVRDAIAGGDARGARDDRGAHEQPYNVNFFCHEPPRAECRRAKRRGAPCSRRTIENSGSTSTRSPAAAARAPIQ